MRLAKLWHNRLWCSLIRGMYELMLGVRWWQELINTSVLMVRMCWVHIEHIRGISGCRSCRSGAVHDLQHSWWDHSYWCRGFFSLQCCMIHDGFYISTSQKLCSEIMYDIHIWGYQIYQNKVTFSLTTASTSDHHVAHNTTLSSHCSPLLSL